MLDKATHHQVGALDVWFPTAWDMEYRRLPVIQIYYSANFKDGTCIECTDLFTTRPEQGVQLQKHRGSRTLTSAPNVDAEEEDVKHATIEDLELWHNTFDPSRYLITRIGNSSIDRQLDHKPFGDIQSLLTLQGSGKPWQTLHKSKGKVYRCSCSRLSYYQEGTPHLILRHSVHKLPTHRT